MELNRNFEHVSRTVELTNEESSKMLCFVKDSVLRNNDEGIKRLVSRHSVTRPIV